MTYKGQFRSIDNVLYTVEIITGGLVTDPPTEITMSGSPFVTEMDTSDENIYKPAKYQSATVGVVTKNASDYMFNVYSGNAKGTKITLYEGDNIVWAGYATPVLYNNGYTEVHEQIEIEAIDGLSILQYYKYNAQTKSIKSFRDILLNILNICGVYTELYVSAAGKLTSESKTSLIDDLYISEQNFFDEKEDNETDDDVAWTDQEVLEEICQYLGLVCVGHGDKVFLLDYDAIKNNVNTYWKYEIGTDNVTPTSVTLLNPISLSGSMYRGNNSTISLDNVYNKVSVKDDFYTFDNILPDIYETSVNKTKSTDPTLSSSENVNNGMYGEVVQGKEGNTGGDTNNNMICMLDRVYDPQHDRYSDYNAVFVKYFVNPYYKFYGYNRHSTANVNNSINYTDTKNMFGACVAKFSVNKLDKSYSQMEIIVHKIYNNEIKLDDWLARNEISSLSFNNYIMMLNPDNDYHITNSSITNYPYFESLDNNIAAFIGGQNAYLVIQGSYMYHYMCNGTVNGDPYPIPEGEVDISEGRYAMDAGQTYLLAKLQWGDKYWDGDKWGTTSKTFKIPYMRDDASGDDRRADATMFDNITFVNTVSWRIGTSEKGYVIPVPTDELMTGIPKITVYKPYDPNYHSTRTGSNEGQHYKHAAVFLKDFNMKAIIGDPTYSDVNKTDTIFTNVIDNNHVQELDEIKFKICTHDNKNPNYSAVGYKNGNTYTFLQKIYNSAMTNNGVVSPDGTTSSGSLSAEEWLIYRLTHQYSQPKVRLTLELKQRFAPYSIMTDHWIAGKYMIVDSQSTDFRTGQTTIVLVEKG